MSDKRNRIKQTASLQDRLSAFAGDAIAKARAMPPGREKDELLKKAKLSKVASEIDAWAHSPDLQSQK